MKIPFGRAQRAAIAGLPGVAFSISVDGTEARFLLPDRSEVVAAQVITSTVKGAELHLVPDRSAGHRALAQALGFPS